jgi:hypothetical protein
MHCRLCEHGELEHGKLELPGRGFPSWSLGTRWELELGNEGETDGWGTLSVFHRMEVLR